MLPRSLALNDDGTHQPWIYFFSYNYTFAEIDPEIKLLG